MRMYVMFSNKKCSLKFFRKVKGESFGIECVHLVSFIIVKYL